MSNFADYTEITYIDGDTPAINATNLNKNEEALNNIMSELNYSKGFSFEYVKEYGYNRGMLDVEDFEDVSVWSSAGAATLSQEYAVVYGASGIKCSESDNTGSRQGIYRSISSKDLTVFNNGDDAPANVYVCLLFYVSNDTLVNYLVVDIGTDSSNYYRFSSSNSSFSTGWTYRDMREDNFSVIGSPSWDNIGFLRFQFDTADNAQGEYVIFNKLFLVRRDGGYFSGNPFYYDDGSGNFTEEPYIISDYGSIVSFDNKLNRLGNTIYGNYIYPNMNEIFCTVNSFYFKGEAYSKISNYGMCIQWYIDSNL